MLNWLNFQQKILLAAYQQGEAGDYAYRPHAEDSFAGVTIIHLPTGKVRMARLSPEYEDYGLWLLADPEKGTVFFQGLGFQPSRYELSASFVDHHSVRRRKYKGSLMAASIEVPK